MIPRPEIEAAKERLLIPELWRILDLPGEPMTRDNVKFASPLRPDANPSCSFRDGCKRMTDWTTGRKYDAVEFLGEALGLRNGEALRRFVEIANGHAIPIQPAPVIRSQPKAKSTRPKLSGLRNAAHHQLEQIAKSRNISVRAVELAQDLGTLRVAEVCGFLSWVLLDESGLCAEARRFNRKPYPEIKTEKMQLGERKAHTLGGSQKNWPVGVLPAREYRQSIEVLALVEGGPDYLAALHFALAQKRTGILPVALLGRCQGLHGLQPDSLQYLRGMRVRIYPHNDADNGSYKSASVIAKQLKQVNCEVDCFLFDGLEKTNGSKVKDLNDCCDLAPNQSAELEELFP